MTTVTLHITLDFFQGLMSTPHSDLFAARPVSCAPDHPAFAEAVHSLFV